MKLDTFSIPGATTFICFSSVTIGAEQKFNDVVLYYMR